jgi:hypothetical protein
MPETLDDAPASTTRIPLFADLQLLVVILLGIVSVATAYTSFQAALYGGMQAAAYSKGGASQTEAESLYLEANQQYIQDGQILTRLTELSIDMESSDPVLAELASAKFDTLLFTAVSEDLQAAIDWSVVENDANPDFYVSPQESEDYNAALFGAWADLDDESLALLAKGDVYNSYGDRLTLNTVLMAITLFLLGIAAVLRNRRAQWILIGVGLGIFVIAGVLTTLVPFVWL